jgi:hypothetical protein
MKITIGQLRRIIKEVLTENSLSPENKNENSKRTVETQVDLYKNNRNKWEDEGRDMYYRWAEGMDLNPDGKWDTPLPWKGFNSDDAMKVIVGVDGEYYEDYLDSPLSSRDFFANKKKK